jgi:hypothetical protein
MARREITGCSAAIATIALACLCLTPFGPSGCAVYKAAAAPSLKDLTVLNPGTARDRVIAELGPPVRTENIGNYRKDVFTFIQGYSKASKNTLAAVIALEDIATLGAAELAFQNSGDEHAGKKITVAVYYDASDVVTRSETILVTQP